MTEQSDARKEARQNLLDRKIPTEDVEIDGVIYEVRGIKVGSEIDTTGDWGYLRLLIGSVFVKGTGEQVFADDDLDMLKEQHAGDVGWVARMIKAMNKVNKGDSGNSETTPDDSGSGG